MQFGMLNLKDLLGEPVKYDVVVNLATIPSVGVFKEIPALVIKNNLDSTVSALEHCRKAGMLLINISSISAVRANCDKNPRALSKKMGEQVVNTYRETYSVKATNVRLFNVFGPSET